MYKIIIIYYLRKKKKKRDLDFKKENVFLSYQRSRENFKHHERKYNFVEVSDF